MSKLREVIRYISRNYPHAHELSNARLTKMVYLTDWEAAKKNKDQMTDIKWYFNNFGPYVEDVLSEAKSDPKINVLLTTTMYGTPKIQLEYVGESGAGNLSDNEKGIIDSVINDTKQQYWNSFIKYVYDTYPIKDNPRYSELNLVQLAEQEQASLANEAVIGS